MQDRVNSRDFFAMMKCAGALIREQQARLSQLDSVAGDGDHGTTMVRIMSHLEAAFTSERPVDLRECFCAAGWAAMNSDGGASSSLLGVFFLGIGESAEEGSTTWDCAQLTSAFQGGWRAVKAQTKARPGDKTLMDALTPSVEALGSAAEAGQSIFDALQVAAKAAKTGAEGTENMIAHYGRARLLGDKTLGSQDAGAASVALIFQGFSQVVSEMKGNVAHARC